MGHLPAEWSEQDGCLISWPGEQSGFADPRAAQNACLELIAAISQREDVVVACRDAAECGRVEDRLAASAAEAARVRTLRVPHAGDALRTFGPQTVMMVDQPHLLDFRAPAHHGERPSPLDEHFPRQLHESGLFADGIRMSSLNFELEGGAVETNGTDSLLLSRSAVPRTMGTPRPMEAMLTSFYRYTHVLWLEHGAIPGDRSGGRIDMRARFVDHDAIAHVTREGDAGLEAMERELASLTTPDGTPYRLVPLPLPETPVTDDQGQSLPATYAQFVVINEAVLVPAFDDPMDQLAAQRLAEIFPDREIVSIDARALLTPTGGLHALVLPLPRGAMAYTADRP